MQDLGSHTYGKGDIWTSRTSDDEIIKFFYYIFQNRWDAPFVLEEV